MSDEETTTTEEPKQKRKRRTKAEIEADNAALAAAKAEKEAPAESEGQNADAEQTTTTELQTDSASDNTAANSEKPSEGVILAPSIGDSIGSTLWIQNTSRNTIIVPLSATERETIYPSRAWNVPREYLEHVKSWMNTEYFCNQTDAGNIKVLDRSPSRLGEADLKKIPTAKAPESLTATDGHITEAGFKKKD